MRTRPLGAIAIAVAALAVPLGLPVARSAEAAATWRSRGPSTGGIVSAVAAAPSSATIVYAAVNSLHGDSPVYKSTDAGETWRPTGPDIPATSIAPQHLAVDPANADTVYYADYDGAYRTLDGGESWTDIGTGISGGASGLALDPNDARVVYLGTTKGLYRTSNSGGSWTSLTSGLPANASSGDVAVAPSAPNLVYAMIYDPQRQHTTLYRSANAGGSWSPTALPRITTVNPQIAISPSDPSLVYVAIGELGVVKSADGGATWNTASGGLPATISFRSLVLDPTVPGTLYAAGSDVDTGLHDLYRTTDGGASWSRVRGGLPDSPSATFWSVSVSHRAPGHVFVATSSGHGGVYRSADAGTTWQASSDGLPADTTIRGALAVDPAGTVWAGQYSGGYSAIFQGRNHGSSWRPAGSGVPPVSISSIDVSSSHPDVVYASSYAGPIYRTADGGRSWTATASPATMYSIEAVVVDPMNPQTAYAGGAITELTSAQPTTVFKTTDGGATWSNMSLGLPHEDIVRAMAIDPKTPSTLYVATAFHGVYKTTDGGGTWLPMTLGLPVGTIALEVDPVNPSTVYAGTFSVGNRPTAGVFKTTTGGALWLPSGSWGRDVTSIAVNPANPQQVFASTTNGTASTIMASGDGGATWAASNDGLDTSKIVYSLAIDAEGKYLHAATMGRGVWDLQLG